MVDKKLISAGLDKVGKLIDVARASKRKISRLEAIQAKRTLGSAAAELFKMKAANAKAIAGLATKVQAIKKSASEKLIAEVDASKELRTTSASRINLRVASSRIAAALESVKKLANEVSGLVSPELDKLDKGHTNDAAIPAPATTAARHRLALRRKKAEVNDEGTVPADRAPQKNMADGMEPLFPNAGNIDEKEKGAPSTEQAPSVNMASRKKAQALYNRARALVIAAGKTKDKVIAAKNLRAAASLERVADRLAKATSENEENYFKKKELERRKNKPAGESGDVPTTSSLRLRPAFARKASTTASTVVFAAKERVLLADGSIGVVSSVQGSRLMVSVAGVVKPVLSSTCKKIMSITRKANDEAPEASVKADEKNVTIKLPAELVEDAIEKAEAKAESKGEEKPEEKAEEKSEKSEEKPEMPEPKSASLSDRIRNAINVVRGGKKVKAEADAPAPASVEAPAPKAEAPASGGDTVGKNFSMTYAPAANGKFTVQINETEIVECETEDEAKAIIARGSKKKATTNVKDAPTDSSTTKKPDASADVAKTLKGLDQSGKGYSSTDKNQKVDEQFSMVKKSTTNVKDSPTDSATTKKPDGSTDVATALKGLDQSGKGYSSTDKNQKVDEQFSMVKKSNADLKIKILADSNRKHVERLATVEAELLVSRAVKVGAIAEAARGEQMSILANLYKDSPAEFKAYARLIENQEATASTTPSLAVRATRKVEASLTRRTSELVDGGSIVTSASLENGNFFDNEF